MQKDIKPKQKSSWQVVNKNKVACLKYLRY